MKIHVQVVSSMNDVSQYGGIDEPVKEGHEIDNALAHFGIKFGDCVWEYKSDNFLVGKVKDTYKLVTIIKNA